MTIVRAGIGSTTKIVHAILHLPMADHTYPRVASFRDVHALAGHLEQLGWALPFDDTILTADRSPLADPLDMPWQGGRRRVGNRFAVQPMEGWDGELDGSPSELTRRRWLRFGASGAKLLWGGEAVAVLPEARANPNQLVLNESTAAALGRLREEIIRAHRERFGTSDDLIFGLQLTHSGRFCRPKEKASLEPVIVYHHPLLDAKFPAASRAEPLNDAEIERIVEAFGTAARLAREIGFDFVDLKHCHGYLGHEFLSAYHRAGRYGGSFENRTRFLRECIEVVRARAPGLEIGVRVSAYDSVPFAPDPETGRGRPLQLTEPLPYTWAFGMDSNDPCRPDLTEATRLLEMLASLDVRLVNVSASSPYYCAHLQRPALFPPCDAYLPPEDPLAGAARLISAARELKQSASAATIVSTGWSYFQDYLPHFAQAAVRAGSIDFVGLGRMMLAYPELPADVLERGRLERKIICRTFSDCTNGPRNGMISGCFPLDPFYKALPQAKRLQEIKLETRSVPAHS